MTDSTEDKIKEAARKVFTQKGYAATRTRDIAQEAGINLALLNYYFRSKEKLFELVMKERIDELFGAVIPVLVNKNDNLSQKIEKITEIYFNLLSQNPDLPMFVLNEIKNKPDNSHISKYLKELFNRAELQEVLDSVPTQMQPFHFLVNFIGSIVFPFVARPILITSGRVSSEEYLEIIKQQKAIIPQLVQNLMNIKIEK